MSAEGGAKAVLAALLANLGIAVSKFVAFLVTGSSSLLAESVHSLADCGNQGLLLLGRRTARRAADETHPFGYGRDRYFYAFVVSVVLFTLGSLFALYEGIHKITNPEPIESAAVAIGVLLVAIVLESLSFRTAIKEANPVRGGRSWPGFIRHTTSPDLPVILLEDAAALLGLVFALVGVVLAELTGSPIWDGIGTLAIGVLLGLVAAVLAVEMKSLLIGESATAGQVRAIRTALTGAEGINFCGASSTTGLVGNFQDRSGSQLPNSPRFKFNLSTIIEQSLGGEAKGSIGINYQHQSGVSFDLLGDPLLVQKAYGIFNGSVGVEYKSVKFTAFATNLFNTHYASALTDVFGTTGVHTVVQFLPRDSRRYFGFRIAAKY